MKRQWKLIFEILLYVEQNANNGKPLSLPELDDYTQDEVAYHVNLCEEAGFFSVKRIYSRPSGLNRLTWKGHNELDRLRDEGCQQ